VAHTRTHRWRADTRATAAATELTRTKNAYEGFLRDDANLAAVRAASDTR
jgi:hypothetical protein